MTFRVNITRFMDFVQVTVTGPAAIRSFVELVQDIETESLTWADRKVLVDLRAVEGRLDAAEQVFLGEMVAQRLPHLDKLASVVPEAEITHNSEAAAQKLGMQLRVFTSHGEAVAWLKARPPKAAGGEPSTSRPMGLTSDAP